MTRSLAQRAAVPIGRCDAATVAWQLKGEIRVTAIVKATFAFAPDAPMPRVDPRPIIREDVHHSGNAMRSIVLASDLAPYKKRADVLFTGQAHAPAGASESMTVSFGLTGETSGDRPRVLFEKALLIRKKGGFDRLRLLYEHAVGGPGDEENPFGEDPEDDESAEEVHVFDPRDASRPAGFAPVPRTMSPRKRLLGALPIPALGPEIVQIPDAFSFDFFQVAPPDQRTDFLRGDEQILLSGLHPRVPRLQMRLPGCRGVARVFGLSAFGIPEGTALAMYADTLHVSGEEERCFVTWRGTFAVPSEAALSSVRIAAAVEMPGEPVVWPSRDELEQAAMVVEPSRSPAAARASTETLQLSDDDIEVVSSSSSATLPLTPAAALAAAVTPFRSAASIAATAAPSGGSPIVKVPPRGSGTETLPVPSSAARAAQGSPLLPFRPAAPGAAGAASPASAEKRRTGGSAGETLPLASFQNRAAGAVLPFGATSGDPSRVSAASALNVSTQPSPAPTEKPAATSPAPPAEAAPGGTPPQVAVGATTPGEDAIAPEATPARNVSPAPAPQQASPIEAPAPVPSVIATGKSPWAPPPEAPPAPPPPPAPKKLPPKVDVKSRLYGSSKKGR